MALHLDHIGQATSLLENGTEDGDAKKRFVGICDGGGMCDVCFEYGARHIDMSRPRAWW